MGQGRFQQLGGGFFPRAGGCSYPACQQNNIHYAYTNGLAGGMGQYQPPEWLQRYYNLGAQQYQPPKPDPIPGDVKHMKQAEKVIDGEPLLIEHKPRKGLLKRLFGI